MSIGKRLKKLREERGMTQAELAAMVGTCQQTMIASIEADAKQMPLGTAIALSDIFGVTMDYLCKGKEA